MMHLVVLLILVEVEWDQHILVCSSIPSNALRRFVYFALQPNSK